MATDEKLDTSDASLGNAAPLSSAKTSGEKETGVLATKPSDDFAAEDSSIGAAALRGPNGEEYPTAEELHTLRRVKGPISWIIYTIAFIELCERFSYYGTTAVCMSDGTNF